GRYSGFGFIRRKERRSHLRQRFQNRPNPDENDHRTGFESPYARAGRLVFYEHSRQPRRRSARRPGKFQNERRIETFRAGTHSAARKLSETLQGFLARRPHQLLSAARR